MTLLTGKSLHRAAQPSRHGTLRQACRTALEGMDFQSPLIGPHCLRLPPTAAGGHRSMFTTCPSWTGMSGAQGRTICSNGSTQSRQTIYQIPPKHKGLMSASKSSTSLFCLSDAERTKHRKWVSNAQHKPGTLRPEPGLLPLTPPWYWSHYFLAPLFLHQKFPWGWCWPGGHAWAALWKCQERNTGEGQSKLVIVHLVIDFTHFIRCHSPAFALQQNPNAVLHSDLFWPCELS